MTKAERIFAATRYECRKSIVNFGYKVNPDGSAVGYNTTFHNDDECICARTLNDMEKILRSKRSILAVDRKLGIGDDARITLEEQILNMVESTIRNARANLA